ncbi:uncharacterized protein ISCGN_010103 [Ixodes scapularis]
MPNFSEAEITALVDGYEDHKLAIQARTSGPHGSLAKQRAWAIITASLFAVSGVRRSVNEVKKKWTDYKSANKIRGAAVRRSQNATGGGPGEPELTDAEERVIGLLSEASLVGIEGAFDIGARQLVVCKHEAPHILFIRWRCSSRSRDFTTLSSTACISAACVGPACNTGACNTTACISTACISAACICTACSSKGCSSKGCC